MLTKLTVRRFKKFDDIEIELGQNVVLIGPTTPVRRPRCKASRCGASAFGAGRRSGRMGRPRRSARASRSTGRTASPFNGENWNRVRQHILDLFGVELERPEYIASRGEVALGYREQGTRFDLSCSGRGLQQTLLLLAHLYTNANAVLLMDEPDAHLEILRQRQIYQVLTDATTRRNSQLIAASHSEVILNEAADRDLVIAFIGQPHRIDDRGTQVLKSLKDIGFQDYYQAEQTGWVLYLEGSSDLAILRGFARILDHPAQEALERPFVQYVLNKPNRAREHFYGLREAKRDLVGIALYDQLNQAIDDQRGLWQRTWSRREIENYLCYPEVLMAYADAVPDADVLGPLFAPAERAKRRDVMHRCIREFAPPVALRDRDDEWWHKVKASDEFLDRVFRAYFQELRLPNLMNKSGYHQLARYVPPELIADEIAEKLDAIQHVQEAASPRT
jgi:hypothetical protein